MPIYCPPPSPDEIFHHGILGQKWGKRNGPPYPLGASDHSASERKAGWKKSLDGGSRKATRLNRSAEKTIASVNKQLSSTMAARKKNRDKIEEKYNKKYDKAYKKGASDERLKFIRDKESYKLKDFDEGTRYVKAGYDRYIANVSKYRDVKIKQIDNKIYKNSPEYKKAVRDYTNQIISDSMNYGGRQYTILDYTTQYAQNEKKELQKSRGV